MKLKFSIFLGGSLLFLFIISGSKSQPLPEKLPPKPVALKDNAIIKKIGDFLGKGTSFVTQWKPARKVLLFILLVPYLQLKAVLRNVQQKMNYVVKWGKNSKLPPKVVQFLSDLIDKVLEVIDIERSYVVSALPTETKLALGALRFFGGGAVKANAVNSWGRLQKNVFSWYPTKEKPKFEPTSFPKFKPPSFANSPSPTSSTVKQREVPDAGTPSEPNLKPTMPKFEPPTMPKFEPPTMPKFEPPTMPKFEQPTMPKFEQPTMPKFEPPTMPKSQPQAGGPNFDRKLRQSMKMRSHHP